MSADLLRRAADKLREHAEAALRDSPDQRWMVDQSSDAGLVVGSFVPEDVDDDGSVSTGCIAFFAYPDDDDAKAYAGALDVASYMALMHPPVALALADVMDAVAPAVQYSGGFAARLGYGELIAVARAVLREDGESA